MRALRACRDGSSRIGRESVSQGASTPRERRAFPGEAGQSRPGESLAAWGPRRAQCAPGSRVPAAATVPEERRWTTRQIGAPRSRRLATPAAGTPWAYVTNGRALDARTGQDGNHVRGLEVNLGGALVVLAVKADAVRSAILLHLEALAVALEASGPFAGAGRPSRLLFEGVGVLMEHRGHGLVPLHGLAVVEAPVATASVAHATCREARAVQF